MLTERLSRSCRSLPRISCKKPSLNHVQLLAGDLKRRRSSLVAAKDHSRRGMIVRCGHGDGGST